MKKLEELEVGNEDFTPPMVTNTPEGWPDFATMPGETWYERAMNFEKWSGHAPLPSNYLYDSQWRIVPADNLKQPTADQFVQPEPSDDILENGGYVEWSGDRNGSSNSK